MTTESRQKAPAATQAFQAWQDGISSMLSGYNRQASQLSTGMWGMRIDPTTVRESFSRIAAESREVAGAQVAVASEFLRIPFYLTGTASPAGLQKSYGRLFEAYNRLFSAYMTAAAPLRETVERTVNTAAKVADTQVKTAREITEDVATAQKASSKAAIDATTTLTSQAVRASANAVDQAIEVANQATRRAERQSRAASHPAQLIKGNLAAGGEKIYHIPGQSSYDRTQAEATFATEEEAQAAGFRRAETPGGGKVKGKVSRTGERIYHVAGQANYDRFDADMLFETEEAAQAAGFRPSRR